MVDREDQESLDLGDIVEFLHQLLPAHSEVLFCEENNPLLIEATMGRVFCYMLPNALLIHCSSHNPTLQTKHIHTPKHHLRSIPLYYGPI